MAKGSGGAGRAGSGKREDSLFGNEPSHTFKMSKHKSSGGVWKETALVADKDGDGGIYLSYAPGKNYKDINRNTTEAEFTIDKGIYTAPYAGTVSLNINWDQVKKVSGQTFNVSDYLKRKGFRFDRTSKSWVKPGS